MNMKELFQTGASFRTFILNQKTAGRGSIMKHYIPMTVKDEDRLEIDKVSTPLNILGIAEGDCPDCQISLAVLEKLISVNQNINLRLITNKDAQGSMESFAGGTIKLPTFIFMNESFEEKAVIEGLPQASMTIDQIAELMRETIKKTI